jgi:hypothetical protein
MVCRVAKRTPQEGRRETAEASPPALPAAVSADTGPPAASAGAPARGAGRRPQPAGLSKLFLAALVGDFARHGGTVIEKLREGDPAQYLKLCAALLPKEEALRAESGAQAEDAAAREDLEALSDDELFERARRLAERLGFGAGAGVRKGRRKM